MNPSSPSRILIVDDSPENIHLLLEILRGGHEIIVATSGEQAFQRLESATLPDLILLDIIMPGLDGYEVCRRLKADPRTQDIPVLFLTALDSERDEAHGLELGAVDFITKPFSPIVVRQRVSNQLELKHYRDHLETLVQNRTRELQIRTNELELTKKVTIMSLGALAEFRDPETGGHIQRTAKYVHLVAEFLATLPEFRQQLTPSTIDWLSQSAPLHDIGKVGIRDEILLKPGKLLPDEFAIMRTHCFIGYQALKISTSDLGTTSFLDIAMDMAYSHHERWDGTGYPRQLHGDAIPIPGRIMALADVYDALRSERPYKVAFSHAVSSGIILKEMADHFDPRILAAFYEVQAEFQQISETFRDEPVPPT